MSFSDAELSYIRSQRLLRIATVSSDGQPDVVPVGYQFDGTHFYIGGYAPTNTRRARNVRAGNHKVAFVIDDLVSVDPWTPRYLRVYGDAELVDRMGQEVLKITPRTSWSMNLSGEWSAGRTHGLAAHKTIHQQPRRTESMPANASTGPVLVVGATGHLGGQVVTALLERGKTVRALVRPSTDASKLESRGVEIARGDMLDLESLIAAMTGVDAVISTAAGYTRGGKSATDIDTIGNANLATAAHEAGVRRFVLTSILTSDQTPNVPHFWHKKLAEDKLAELGVPFVALRPGAFLDQVATMAGNPVEKGRIMWMGRRDVPLTFVLTSDLAGYLAQAVDADVRDGERIDIGWDRPVSISQAVALLSEATGTNIKARAIPPSITKAAGAVVGLFVPFVKDMASMFRWFDSGKYVADTRRQTEVFGKPPTAENAVNALAAELRR